MKVFFSPLLWVIDMLILYLVMVLDLHPLFPVTNGDASGYDLMAGSESSSRWVGVSSPLFPPFREGRDVEIVQIMAIATKHYPHTGASLGVTGNSKKNKKPPQNNSSFLIS